MWNSDNMLPVGKKLRGGTLTVVQQLSSGGFGNTYVVRNNFDELFAMKEFFMRDINHRVQNNVTVSIATNKGTFESCRAKFAKEAKRLHDLSNDHIVHVHDLFDENNTSYYLMDYIDGESLAGRLKRTQNPLSESETLSILSQVIEALEYIHGQGIWHLDLKPANIMIDKRGKVVLIDFGASKQIDSTGGYTATSTALCYSPNYAPTEQIEHNLSKIGPWTDFYSLGATLYNLLTNSLPPSTTDISDEGSDAFHFGNIISLSMRQGIMALMQPSRKKRPQMISDVKSLFESISEVSEQKGSSHYYGDATIYDKPAVAVPNATSGFCKDEKTTYENQLSYPKVGLRVEESLYENQQHTHTLLTKELEEKIDQRLKNHWKRDVVKKIISNMVYVEGGSYTMGNVEIDKKHLYLPEDAEDALRAAYKHEVILSPFYISKYVLTFEDYFALENKLDSFYPSAYESVRNNPITCEYGYDSIRGSISRLRGITSMNFNLPTEAQWEYAARGGRYSKGFLYSGGNNLNEVGWYKGNNHNKYLGIFNVGRPEFKVGQFKPNELGLYDMSGGVDELCRDLLDKYPITKCVDPLCFKYIAFSEFSRDSNNSKQYCRIVRGGNFKSNSSKCNVFTRSYKLIDEEKRFSDNSIGVRIVLEIGKEKQNAMIL